MSNTTLIDAVGEVIEAYNGIRRWDRHPYRDEVARFNLAMVALKEAHAAAKRAESDLVEALGVRS